MSSYARFRIFRKVAKKRGLYNSKMHDNLEEMSRIRNTFAHCMSVDPKNTHGFEVFGVKKTNIDFEKDFQRFIKLIKETSLYMSKIWEKVYSV